MINIIIKINHMDILLPLLIIVVCGGFLISLIKHILYIVIESDSSGKFIWGTRRKISDWITLCFMILSAIIIASTVIWGIYELIKNLS